MSDPSLDAATSRALALADEDVAERVLDSLTKDQTLSGGAQVLGMGLFADAIRGGNPAAILATYQRPADVAPLAALARIAPPQLATLAMNQLHAGSGIPAWMNAVAQALRSTSPPKEEGGVLKRLLRRE